MRDHVQCRISPCTIRHRANLSLDTGQNARRRPISCFSDNRPTIAASSITFIVYDVLLAFLIQTPGHSLDRTRNASEEASALESLDVADAGVCLEAVDAVEVRAVARNLVGDLVNFVDTAVRAAGRQQLNVAERVEGSKGFVIAIPVCRARNLEVQFYSSR